MSNEIAGIDVSGLPVEVQKAIRAAAEKAAARVVKKAFVKEKAKADELKKWASIANAISNALTKEQRDSIGDGSFRVWFENGKPKTWRVFKSRNGAGGENTVWLHVPDKKHHVEFASGEALCKHLGLATNGNSAPRVLAKNHIPFVKTRPQGKVVLA